MTFPLWGCNGHGLAKYSDQGASNCSGWGIGGGWGDGPEGGHAAVRLRRGKTGHMPGQGAEQMDPGSPYAHARRRRATRACAEYGVHMEHATGFPHATSLRRAVGTASQVFASARS